MKSPSGECPASISAGAAKGFDVDQGEGVVFFRPARRSRSGPFGGRLHSAMDEGVSAIVGRMLTALSEQTSIAGTLVCHSRLILEQSGPNRKRAVKSVFDPNRTYRSALKDFKKLPR